MTLSAATMGNNLRLYTGPEYVRNGIKALGYPFFQSEDALDGSFVYDGASYDHIPLQYDLVTDEVHRPVRVHGAAVVRARDVADERPQQRRGVRMVQRTPHR